MVHAIITTDYSTAGEIPNYDTSQPLGFLANGGIIVNYIDQYDLLTDTSSPGKVLMTIPQNAGLAVNFEISLYQVTSNASGDSTIVVNLWEYTLSLTGNVGIYNAPSGPLSSISMTVPTGSSQVVYGNSPINHTFATGSAVAVSLTVTDLSYLDGSIFDLRYLALVS